MWVVLFIRVPFWVPNIVRHSYKQDPNRDLNLENYAYMNRLNMLLKWLHEIEWVKLAELGGNQHS